MIYTTADIQLNTFSFFPRGNHFTLGICLFTYSLYCIKIVFVSSEDCSLSESRDSAVVFFVFTRCSGINILQMLINTEWMLIKVHKKQTNGPQLISERNPDSIDRFRKNSSSMGLGIEKEFLNQADSSGRYMKAIQFTFIVCNEILMF